MNSVHNGVQDDLKEIQNLLLRPLCGHPLIPSCILSLKCCAGIAVTASHHPKGDNSFKVYLGNGAQIIPPHDAGIASSILT